MTDHGGHGLRWARALVLALVAAQLGAFAHVTAGGLMPGPGTLALVTAGLVVACAATIGVRRSAWRVVALLVAGQAFVHGALTLTAGHHQSAAGPTATHRAGHHAGAAAAGTPHGHQGHAATAEELASHHAGSGLELPGPVAHLSADLSAHADMALAHLVAAVLLGAWLAWGERALWRLAGRLSTAVPAALARRAAVLLAALASGFGVRPLGRPVAAPGRAVATDLLLHSATRLLAASRARVRRGPPAALPA